MTPPPPEPPQPVEPLRLVPRAPRPPTADVPLTEAPEVPRAQAPPTGPTPEVPLSAPEAVDLPGGQPASVPAPPEPPPVPPSPARRFARPTPWPPEAADLWRCELAWKAGYRKSTFRALAHPSGAGKPRAIAESPAVRWTLMGEPDPPTPELAIRVRALVSALEAAGWEHIGRGPAWYAQRFVWRRGGEPQPIEGAAVEEPAER